MCNEMIQDYSLTEVDMQKIDSIINELKTIMQLTGITQTSIVNALDGKCSRNTVLSFFNGGDCKLSTLLMVLDACKTELRLETDKSKQAILSGDISEYRAEVEKLRSELEDSIEHEDYYKTRYEELIEKNTLLTKTLEKQQSQIEKYMERMENAENALYSAQADIRRKDAKIVELLSKVGKW